MGPLQTQIGHRHATRRVLLRGVTVADFQLTLRFGRGAARTVPLLWYLLALARNPGGPMAHRRTGA